VTRGRCAVLWRGRHVQDPIIRRRRMAERGSSNDADATAGPPTVAELEYLRDIVGWPSDAGQM
jgi:hypothetical protein